MQSYQIGGNEAGQRLDKFLHKFMPTAGSGFLYKMLRKKHILLNNKKAEGKEILAVGDNLSFFFSKETFYHFTGRQDIDSIEGTAIPEDTMYQNAYKQLKNISVIYEDENILVLNKPAGILTQKADNKQASLNEWMIGYLLANKKITRKTLLTFKPSVQNRLDRNTSGLVLCGISLPGSQLLSRLIHDRNIGKYYITVVKGRINHAGEISGFLKKNEKTNQASITKDEGSAIRTAYKPLSYGKDYTCLEVELITGKTHQIRAHMASIGHPILGDCKYGEHAWNIHYHKKQQLLHAARVEFPYLAPPFSELSSRIFEAPLPLAFEEVLANGNMEHKGT